jgi:hypothetical protein
MADQLPDFTRRAGLGPWTQLGDRAQRLKLLAAMGRNEEVLAEVPVLRTQMAALPKQSGQESVNPWGVHEFVLDIAREVATNLGRWKEALGFNAEQIRSLQARGAPDLNVARTMFNDYGPLMELGDLAAAERLLLACRQVFEAEGDLGPLGKTLSALASVEATRGHLAEATRLQQIALRYTYAVTDPEAIAASHHSLASTLKRPGRDLAVVLAHRLAAALIRYRTGSGQLLATLYALAQDLAVTGDLPPLPRSFAELCDRVGQVEGVRLAQLAARLPPQQASNDQILAELIQTARTWQQARH